MSYRFMRLLLFYDLPSVEKEDLKEYRVFRKFLLINGFYMLQESVYSKLLLNNTNAELLIEKIKRNLPEKGIIQILLITEKQFQKIETLLGAYHTTMLETDERIIIF